MHLESMSLIVLYKIYYDIHNAQEKHYLDRNLL